MDTTLLKEILSELEVMKWLLVALLVGFSLLLIFFVRAVTGWSDLVKDSALESKLFHGECQDFYDRGRYKELRGLCERRIKLHPDDKWALYYLGLALLRQEKYADAKAQFTRVRALDPQWGDSVIEYLDEIDEKLTRNMPKSV